MYNAGCQVELKDIGATVKYRGRNGLQGRKCTTNNFWFIKLVKGGTSKSNNKTPQNHSSTHFGTQAVAQFHQPPNQLAYISILTSSHIQLAMFHHQSAVSPPASTSIEAIRNGQFKSFLGLTATLIAKHLPPSKATVKGHMVCTRQGGCYDRNQR